MLNRKLCSDPDVVISPPELSVNVAVGLLALLAKVEPLGLIHMLATSSEVVPVLTTYSTTTKSIRRR